MEVTTLLLATLVGGVTLFVWNAIWWKSPWRNTLTSMLDNIVGFALVGITMHLVV